MVTPSFVVIVFICISPVWCERFLLGLSDSAFEASGRVLARRTAAPPIKTSRRETSDLDPALIRASAGLSAAPIISIIGLLNLVVARCSDRALPPMRASHWIERTIARIECLIFHAPHLRASQHRVPFVHPQRVATNPLRRPITVRTPLSLHRANACH